MTDPIEKEYSILVVEDELPLQNAIRMKLESNGIVVATARTAKQAKEYLELLPKVDAIWLDHYLLGEENGLDLLAELKKESSAYKNIPIFVVSNSIDQKKINSYIGLGVEKYFTKTECSLLEIIEDIRAFIQQHV
jgi:two-component response regulator (ARR-A family)